MIRRHRIGECGHTRCTLDGSRTQKSRSKFSRSASEVAERSEVASVIKSVVSRTKRNTRLESQPILLGCPNPVWCSHYVCIRGANLDCVDDYEPSLQCSSLVGLGKIGVSLLLPREKVAHPSSALNNETKSTLITNLRSPYFDDVPETFMFRTALKTPGV